MKKLFKSALVVACVVLMSSYAKAQQKIGYVNFEALVTSSPKFPEIQKQIEAYQNQFLETLKAMNSELQTKATDYDAKKASMTDAIRTKTEGELQDLQKRIQDLNTSASNQVQQKSNELYKPLVDLMKGVVSQVAKEKGYTYVLDSSRTEMIVSPEGDDLLAAAKAKAGIGATTAAPARTPVKK
jgi:outer membrane protein